VTGKAKAEFKPMAELPRGAVTFLFADIEGSTQRVKQLRDRYAEALAEHERILGEAFSQHGGHVIDTQGAAFFVAFASAREAVLSAVEGQRAISRYPWPDGAPVKVRMGIHTGQTAPVHGRYTGVAVQRAQRIMDAGHGGQVLLSLATQILLEDEEEDLDVGLRDLGQRRIRGLERPIQLYQVAAPGLAAEFPPPREEPEPADLPAPKQFRLSTPRLIVIGVAAVLVIVPIVALLARGGGGGGLSGVDVNHVGLIDPKSNHITAQMQTGVRPGPVAIGQRDVWVGDVEDRDLTRIDAARRTVGHRTPLDNETPTGIAVAQGAVWVAQGLLGKVSRVDRPYNHVTNHAEVAGRSSAGSVAVGGGYVWAVFGDSTLARINPATGHVVGRGHAGSNPAGIVYANGAVWVANRGESTAYRFNPATFESGPVAQTTVGRQPSAIAFGEGAIWVACAADNAIFRIDPASNSTRTIGVGDKPIAVAAGDGGVWVANSGDGTVSRIDPKSFEVVKTIHTGNVPSGIAVGPSGVWVSVQSS
jgi:YVTN family beta-propeller protein